MTRPFNWQGRPSVIAADPAFAHPGRRGQPQSASMRFRQIPVGSGSLPAPIQMPPTPTARKARK